MPALVCHRPGVADRQTSRGARQTSAAASPRLRPHAPPFLACARVLRHSKTSAVGVSAAANAGRALAIARGAVRGTECQRDNTRGARGSPHADADARSAARARAAWRARHGRGSTAVSPDEEAVLAFDFDILLSRHLLPLCFELGHECPAVAGFRVQNQRIDGTPHLNAVVKSRAAEKHVSSS